MNQEFVRQLAWTHQHMPRLRRALSALPTLTGVRLACSMHLDLKMVPLVEGLLAKGAQVFLTTCNPTTVRDEVVTHLTATGAEAMAWQGMGETDYLAAIERALDWEPTQLCEMGADLSAALHQHSNPPPVQAGLEATGSGITRLAGLKPRYPIFNWDDLPVKEGLHNRHMVGLTTMHAFFERTHLTLHERRVLVIGYGLVGRGIADAARAYGGSVLVAERDSVRALEAAYAGWQVCTVNEGLAAADLVITATGGRHIIGAAQIERLRAGAFLLNVGHRADEIDVEALRAYPHREVLPFVEEIDLGGRTIYLFAGGSMANLTAGQGDSLNAFDLTLAVMTAGLGHICGPGTTAEPGLLMLPRDVWLPFI